VRRNICGCVVAKTPLFVVEHIKVLCVLASEAGLKHIQAEYPALEVGDTPVCAKLC